MTTGNHYYDLATSELVVKALMVAGALSMESMDPLALATCRDLLRALAKRFASDPTDLHEPRAVAEDEFVSAYAHWAVQRCTVERERVLGIASRRVLGTGRGGRFSSAHFWRPCGTEAELRSALEELQIVERRRGTKRI